MKWYFRRRDSSLIERIYVCCMRSVWRWCSTCAFGNIKWIYSEGIQKYHKHVWKEKVIKYSIWIWRFQPMYGFANTFQSISTFNGVDFYILRNLFMRLSLIFNERLGWNFPGNLEVFFSGTKWKPVSIHSTFVCLKIPISCIFEYHVFLHSEPQNPIPAKEISVLCW